MWFVSHYYLPCDIKSASYILPSFFLIFTIQLYNGLLYQLDFQNIAFRFFVNLSTTDHVTFKWLCIQQKFPQTLTKENTMSKSVYKIIEMVGSSPDSWEDATQNAVKSAGLSLRDLRIAEVVTLDMKIGDDDKGAIFRARVKLSFKLISD
jgi:flavin-binding protein dodecin